MEIPGDSHGLVPGDASPGVNALRSVTDKGHFLNNTPNPFLSRFLGISSPVIIAGWGYDIFGRPAPGTNASQGIVGIYSLQNINGPNNAPSVDYSLTKFVSASSGGTRFPGGGESLPTQHVAGALDVRYDPRHGLWRTNHFFLAEILGSTTHDNNIFPNRYAWREIEIHELDKPDSTTRAVSSLPFPARSFTTANGIVNYAINLAESSSDPKDSVLSKIPSGTIVQMRSVNVCKETISTSTAVYTNNYAPLYIFEQPGPSTIFLKILGYEAGVIPAPLTASDAYTPNTQSFQNKKMCNRWLYHGEVVVFSGGITGVGRYQTGFGSFVPDTSVPQNLRRVQCVNLIEMGNPVGTRGIVCPGVVTASGTITAADLFGDGAPGGLTVPAGAKSAYPLGFATAPICSGTIVEAKKMPGLPGAINNKGPLYYFQVPNAHDGGCASGLWPFFNATADNSFETTTVARP